MIIPAKHDDVPVIGNDVITIGKLKFKHERTEDGWEWIARDYSEYDRAWATNDCVIVEKAGKLGIITKDKHVLLPLEYENIDSYGRDHLMVVHDGKNEGFFNLQSGAWVFKPNSFIDIYCQDGYYKFIFGGYEYEARGGISMSMIGFKNFSSDQQNTN